MDELMFPKKKKQKRTRGEKPLWKEANLLQGRRKECFVSGKRDNLQKHHIFGGPLRTMSDRNGFWVWLSAEWHNQATYSVHGRDGGELKEELKRKCQEKYMEEGALESWMELVGKNYL